MRIGADMIREFEAVSLKEESGGFVVLLDHEKLETPAGNTLWLHPPNLAKAIADEWASQSSPIDTATMPMTRFAATTLDRVLPNRDEIVGNSVKLAEADLLCYRAPEPEELVQRQYNLWQPLLDWAKTDLNAPMVVTDGILPITQPIECLGSLHRAISKLNEYELMALASLASASGSLVLGLALIHKRIDAESMADAALVEETYQLEKWGDDQDLSDRVQKTRDELRETEIYLKLIGD
ncbi:MAG: ATPase [Proteobacteria bacterium]|nr:ATPase [Pseudomonadota bacterium]